MAQQTTEVGMNNKPRIHAGDLTPEELRDWLLELARNAERTGWDCESILVRLKSAALQLRFALEDLEPRISFLESDEIIRSADHSIAIQEDLNTLKGISVAVRDTQQTILSLIAQLQQIECQAPAPDCKAHHQGCAAQETEKGIEDRQ